MVAQRRPVPVVRCTLMRKTAKTPKEKQEVFENMPEQQHKPSRLLSLPPELRNRIYEYTLISEEIEITPTLKQPPLLHTNREIRSEATKIWYFRNTFTASIDNCDARLMCLFHTHISRKFPTRNEFSNMSVTQSIDDDTPNWANLMVWCKMIYEGKGYGPKPGGELEVGLSVICAVTDVAYQFRRGGGRWRECEVALKTLRCMAGNMDARWLVD